PAVSSSAPSIDRRFAAVIDRCLSKDPLARFETGMAVCAALEPLASGSQKERVKTRRTLLAAGSALLLSLLGVGMYVARHRAPSPSGTMVVLAGGTFQMGSHRDEVEAAALWSCNGATGKDCPRDLFEREQPIRRVTISTFR